MNFHLPNRLKRYLSVLTPSDSLSKQWEKAQQGEFQFWAEVAQNGYNNQSRDEFISEGQRKWMLQQLEFLEKPINSWSNGVVIEFGSGPAGLVEYIQAKRKIAIEPLIDHYRKVFPHLSVSTVEYWNIPAEDIGNQFDCTADLVVCLNVLDHTRDPERVVRNLARVAKTGADLLFQVNVYLTAEQIQNKPQPHAELHPHSFFPHTVLQLLKSNDFNIQKYYVSQEINAYGESYFICAGIKK